MPGTRPSSSVSPASAATPVTVPIVSKKSLSMSAKIVSTATTAPNVKTLLMSGNSGKKDGVLTKSAGTFWTPATIATTVVTRMLMSSAPRMRMTHRAMVRNNPRKNTKCAGVVGKTSSTGGRPYWGGLATAPCPAANGTRMTWASTKPMNRMKSPMPTPIERFRARGTASMIASRRPRTTRAVMARPSRTTTPMAPAGVSPRLVRPKATTALRPNPAASAKG